MGMYKLHHYYCCCNCCLCYHCHQSWGW